MTNTREQLEVTAQLDRARASLGEALGQAQDIGNTGLDVERISESLAGSVKNIFSVQSAGVDDPRSLDEILGAMEYLRNTLEALQDVRDDTGELNKITSTVARILALLYPVSKSLLNIDQSADPGQQASEAEQPLALTPSTPRRSEAPEGEPIPLVAGRPTRRSSISPSSGDRRTNERRFVEVDIGIHSDTNFFTGFSQDISSGGIFIATFDTLGIGERLNVNFTVPGGPVLSVDGIVRWVREYNETTPDVDPGMGVQFESLASEDRSAINYFMTTNPPIFFDDE